MIAHRFEDLIVWQLAKQLELEVFAFTAKTPACHDLRYCDQIHDSARSAPRNIAEGFGRFYPREFARFLGYAGGSLHETKNHLHDGLSRHFLAPEDHERIKRLALRAMKANNRLIIYLRNASPPDQRPPEP